jgi:hypothetical protein
MKLRRSALALLCSLVGLLVLASSPALAHKEYESAGTFGSEGSQGGQLSEPMGVAVNDSTELVTGAGDVYVADEGNNRVERFSASGSYLGQFDGSGGYEDEGKTLSGPAAPGGQLGGPTLIAVDDSGKPVLEDPSVGDVYVVDSTHGVIDKFGPAGEYISQITEVEAAPLVQILGVGVDSAGNLWVLRSAESVEAPNSETLEFSDTGSFMKRGYGPERARADGLAIDARGSIYMVGRATGREQESFEEGLFKHEESEGRLIIAADVEAFAIDQSNNQVLVDKGSVVQLYGPFGEPPEQPQQAFPVGEGLQGSRGVAVNSATHTVYASQRGADTVAVFDYLTLPTVLTERSQATGETTATLNGTIAPEGEAVTECKFDYGTEASYGQSVPCAQTPTEINALSKGGTVPVKVSADVSGLQALATYDFRLDAADANGLTDGNNETLYTFGRPTISDEAVSSIGSTEVNISAQIDPGGEVAAYRVQYGTNNVEEHTTDGVSVGSARASIGVSASLSGLQAGASYHFRFVVANQAGATLGSELVFKTNASQTGGGPTQSSCPNRTFSGFNPALPDCRAYELVSDPIDEVYAPNYDEPGNENSGTGEFVSAVGGYYRAAADGSAIAYAGGESNSGVGGSGATGSGSGNQYLSRYSPKGWSASDVSTQDIGGFTEYSEDFTTQLFSGEESLVEGMSAEPAELSSCGGLAIFRHNSNGFHALVTMNHGSKDCNGRNAGISSDDQSLLFETAGAYTPDARQGLSKIDEFELGYNLYEASENVLRQVNILPDGEPEQQPNAAFGVEYGPYRVEGNKLGDISSDGSRIVWTALHGEASALRPTALYVRENSTQSQSPVVNGGCTVATDACTHRIDAPQGGSESGGEAYYWMTAADGKKLYFTDCHRLTGDSTAHFEGTCAKKQGGESAPEFVGNDLYEYDFERPAGQQLVDLTIDQRQGDEKGADVQGVVGASEDGAYVYFVADGVLAGADAEGRTPVSGQPNLYVLHGASTAFIVTLANSDNAIQSGGVSEPIGDWQLNVGGRSAEVTPDGDAIGFLSTLELTGYDNEVPASGSERIPELFIYQAGTGKVVCASCSPVGATPIPAVGRVHLPGTSVATSAGETFMSHWMVDREGTQAYFMTNQPLAPNDTNGLQDVYEWQSGGSGGCVQVAGCVSLISTAESTSNAYLVEASAGGQDVFFTTRSAITAAGAGERIKLYDARVDGGRPEPSLACVGTGCQGVPPAPPIFATPASVTFEGVGNFEPPSPALKVKQKPRSKKAARCGQGLRRKHNRCVKVRARKRAGKPNKGKSSTKKGR